MDVHSFSGIFTLTNVKFFTDGTNGAVVSVVCVSGDVVIWPDYYPILFTLYYVL